MQTTSALYKQIIADENHWFEVSVLIGNNELHSGVGGADDGIRENALMSVATTNQLFSGSTPSIGNAVSGQIDLEIINLDFEIPRQAEIKLYVRVTDGTNTSEWIKQGVFFVDTKYISQNDNGLNVWTIHGYDVMLKAEQMYPYDTRTRASTVVKNVAMLMGLSTNENGIDPHVWEIIPSTSGAWIQCSGEYTCREHLQYIAALYGGNWTITNEGKLNLVRINDIPYETNLLTDEAGYVLNFGAASTDDTPNAQRIVVGT